MWAAVALSLALAADATAVSAARALVRAPRREVLILPVVFGSFQAAMAALGWLGGDAIESRFSGWGRFIACALLVAIGIKMIIDARRDTEAPRRGSLWVYLGLGLATSIDAAASGPSLPLLAISPWGTVALIGGITAGCSAVGFAVGKRIGSRLGNRLGALAGVVLIAIGVDLWFGGAPGVSPMTGAAPDGQAALDPAPDIRLPTPSHRPPKETRGPIDLATYEKLQGLTFPGFALRPRHLGATGLELRQITENHPRIWATITIGPCQAQALLGDCAPMTVDAWRAKTAELKSSLLHPDLIAAPDTVFEVGMTTINGQPWIFQYQLGQTQPAQAPSGAAVAATSGKRPGEFAWSHAYVLYYNDGHNQIRVVAEYKDDPVKSKQAMAQVVPRADLEKLAGAFADAYTQAW